jgi:hypothetical protein
MVVVCILPAVKRRYREPAERTSKHLVMKGRTCRPPGDWALSRGVSC